MGGWWVERPEGESRLLRGHGRRRGRRAAAALPRGGGGSRPIPPGRRCWRAPVRRPRRRRCRWCQRRSPGESTLLVADDLVWPSSVSDRQRGAVAGDRIQTLSEFTTVEGGAGERLLQRQLHGLVRLVPFRWASLRASSCTSRSLTFMAMARPSLTKYAMPLRTLGSVATDLAPSAVGGAGTLEGGARRARRAPGTRLWSRRRMRRTFRQDGASSPPRTRDRTYPNAPVESFWRSEPSVTKISMSSQLVRRGEPSSWEMTRWTRCTARWVRWVVYHAG
jgi:hypothetical protein